MTLFELSWLNGIGGYGSLDVHEVALVGWSEDSQHIGKFFVGPFGKG